MNEQWRTFLSDQGAEYDASGLITQVPEPVTSASASLYDLSWRSVLRITGADAQDFLHGQFSNDVKALNGQSSQLNSYANPKGRILALFRLLKGQGDFYLDCPAEVLPAFSKRLHMFVMRSDVQIASMDETHAMVGLSGEGAPQALTEAGLAVPEAVEAITVDPDSATIVARLPGNQPRFTLLAPTETLSEHWHVLSPLAGLRPSVEWKHEQVMAGLPEVYTATTEAYVAQMVNLQLTNGLSFKKGCFPGQEVVARLQYLGKLKQRMYLYACQGAEAAPGDSVFSEDTGMAVGDVVEIAKDRDGKQHCLLVLKTAAAEGGQALHLADPDGPLLTRCELPYAFED
ncbi:MAG TPA: folate-binding protein [Gammaproteobacteria bacterium]|nr:folate-binding protein [Gammaproteobacteria bacterium]